MYYWSKYKMRSTGEIVTREYLRELHYNHSFPPGWSTEVSDFLDCDPIDETPQPAGTEFTIHVPGPLVQDKASGFWCTTWIEKDRYTPEELASYKEQLRKDEFEGLNNERIRLLVETDYTQLPDTPITDESRQAYKIYRQELRDIFQNQKDYNNFVWPEKPIYVKS